MATAILIDGGFFLIRYRVLRGNATPRQVAKDLHGMCIQHLLRKNKHNKNVGTRQPLYRIFFYDCPPLLKKVHNPISGKPIDFAASATAEWRLAFHDELRKLRKTALRLGYLNERSGHWIPRKQKLKDLLAKKITVADLTEADVKYDVRQKGVDMRIGLDIASMAFKKQVDQIVLVSGDSDFVPAAKLARREGIDFILDPMWAQIKSDLHEHIDGLRSTLEQNSASIYQANKTPPTT